MIYSIIPNEIIFRDCQSDGQDTPKCEYKEILYKGHLLQVSFNNNEYRVQRIISTNPYDYLNSEIQPGNIITTK